MVARFLPRGGSVWIAAGVFCGALGVGTPIPAAAQEPNERAEVERFVAVASLKHLIDRDIRFDSHSKQEGRRLHGALSRLCSLRSELRDCARNSPLDLSNATDEATAEQRLFKEMMDLGEADWSWASQPLRDDVLKAARHALSAAAEQLKPARQRLEDYARLAGKPHPSDWRPESEVWLELVVAMFQTATPAEFARRWKRRVEDPALGRDLEAIGYFAAAKGRGDVRLDPELLKPLIEKTEPAHLRSHRLAIILSECPYELLEGDVRERLWEELLKSTEDLLTRDSGIYDYLGMAVFKSWARLYVSKGGDSRRERLVACIQRHAQGDLLRCFLVESNFDQQEIFARLCAKTIVLKETPLERREIKTLEHFAEAFQREVPLVLVVDSQVNMLPAPVHLGPLPALEMLEAAAANCWCVLRVAPENILWIGKPERYAGFEEFVQKSVAKARGQTPRRRLKEALDHDARCEFLEVPLSDVLQVLEDFTGIMVVCDHALEKPIALRQRSMPVWLALELVSCPNLIFGCHCWLAQQCRAMRTILNPKF